MFRFRVLAVGLALLALTGNTPTASASTAPGLSPIKPEHETAGPAPMAVTRRSLAPQMPEVSVLQSRRRMQADQAASAGIQFLTRPYATWHVITSVFDHCNPDYTHDGKVCRFDGVNGLASNGVDPGFSLGYAITPRGTDYLYYDGHNGWDYALSYENVLAAADGTVRLAGSDSVNPCFGQTIIVDHSSGYSTRYAHLSAIYVSPGQSVSRAQVIAQSGNTGCSTGPHLHFGVYITTSWTAVDPWGWWGAAGADPWPSDPGDLWLTGSAQFPLPWAPSSPTAIAGKESAAVSWGPPGFDGGTGLTSYIVTVSPGGATVNVAGSVTSAVVGGLTNGTPYTFTVTAVNQVGASSPSSPSNPVTPSGWMGLYRPVTPARILDTRNGTGGVSAPLGAGQAIDVQVVGRGGIPASGVADVALNVTVTNPAKASYVAVYPTGGARPNTSSVNFAAGQTVANLVLVGVGSGGRVTVYNSGGSADVILDVSGWVASLGTSGTTGIFRPLNPARLLDTRYGTGGVSGALGANQAIDLQVTGRGGVPANGVSSVVVNLTVTGPTAAGWLSAYPTGASRPGTSSINFMPNQTIANRAIVPVGTGGKVTIYNVSGRTDAVVDVGGWFSDGSDATLTGGMYSGLTPSRILDTRLSGAPIGPAGIAVVVAGQGDVPFMGAPMPPAAVVINVTVTNPTNASFVTVYPSGTPQPATSDVNFTAGATVSNLVIVRPGSDGKVLVTNFGGLTDLVVDVVGWYS